MSCPKCDGGGDRYLCGNPDCDFVAGCCDWCVPEDGRCPDCGEELHDTNLDCLVEKE